MSATVILGTQFGDEGKGKLVDVLLESEDYLITARCNGGSNAGHEINRNGISYSFHCLPSGLLSPNTKNLIGSGTVVHVPQFFKEIERLREQGIKTDGRIFISDRAHVLFDLHKRIDGLEEKALGGAKIGTTGNGIGPCYSSKAARTGVRMADMLDKPNFENRLRQLARSKKNEFGDLLDYDVEREIREFDEMYREQLRPFIVDGIDMVCTAQDENKQILVEGANALMLDIDQGTWPFLTSSSTGIAGVFVGLGGLRPESLTTRLGVVKAYTTRVGSGPLPSEDLEGPGDELQQRGHEFGTTTGRKRRCGYLDMVILRHSHSINHYTHLNLTKLDVLDTFKEIKVAVAYHSKNDDGTATTYRNRFPADLRALDKDRLEVEYVTLKGWMTDITRCREWGKLPSEARDYVQFVVKDLKVPVKWIGVGPASGAMIKVPEEATKDINGEQS